jgi:prepilin-type N-terminal cleavage/methylation domain-containing protein
MNRRGVTLSELLVAIAIFAVVGVVIYNVYIAAGSFSNDEQQKITVDLSASRILSVMDGNLRQATRVHTADDFGGTTYTTGDDVLVVGLPSLVSGQPSADTDYFAFYLEGGALMMKVDPNGTSSRTAATREVTRDVKDVNFRYTTVVPDQSTAVTVTVATERTIRGSSYTQYSILDETFHNHP